MRAGHPWGGRPRRLGASVPSPPGRLSRASRQQQKCSIRIIFVSVFVFVFVVVFVCVSAFVSIFVFVFGGVVILIIPSLCICGCCSLLSSFQSPRPSLSALTREPQSLRAQSPRASEPRAQSPEPQSLRAQSPKPRAQSPLPRAQSPEPRAQSPEPRAQSPKIGS